MIKFATEQVEAIRIEIELTGDLQRKALSWLNICNNVRDDSDLLKVYNNSGDGVFVICKKDVADAVKDWLENFGRIVEVEEVQCYQPFLLDHKLTDDEMDSLEEHLILPAYVGF